MLYCEENYYVLSEVKQCTQTRVEQLCIIPESNNVPRPEVNQYIHHSQCLNWFVSTWFGSSHWYEEENKETLAGEEEKEVEKEEERREGGRGERRKKEKWKGKNGERWLLTTPLTHPTKAPIRSPSQPLTYPAIQSLNHSLVQPLTHLPQS